MLVNQKVMVTGLAYITGNDLAQGTGFQIIGDGVGS